MRAYFNNFVNNNKLVLILIKSIKKGDYTIEKGRRNSSVEGNRYRISQNLYYLRRLSKTQKRSVFRKKNPQHTLK